MRNYIAEECDNIVGTFNEQKLAVAMRKFLEPQPYPPHYFWEFLRNLCKSIHSMRFISMTTFLKLSYICTISMRVEYYRRYISKKTCKKNIGIVSINWKFWILGRQIMLS